MIDPVSFFPPIPQIAASDRTGPLVAEAGGDGAFQQLLQVLTRPSEDNLGAADDLRSLISALAPAALAGAGMAGLASAGSAENGISQDEGGILTGFADRKRGDEDPAIAEALLALLSVVSSHLRPWQFKASPDASESSAIEQSEELGIQQGKRPSEEAQLPRIEDYLTDPRDRLLSLLLSQLELFIAPATLAQASVAQAISGWANGAPSQQTALGGDGAEQSNATAPLSSGMPQATPEMPQLTVNPDTVNPRMMDGDLGQGGAHYVGAHDFNDMLNNAPSDATRVVLDPIAAGPTVGHPIVRDGGGASGRDSTRQNDAALAFQRALAVETDSSDAPGSAVTRQNTWPAAPVAAAPTGVSAIPDGGAITVGEGPRQRVAVPPDFSVVEQIGRSSRLILERGAGEISVQLEPEDLGKVRVQVSTSADGLSIKLSAEQLGTRDVIEARLSELRANLEHQGHRVEGFDVSYEPNFSGFGSAQNGDARQPSGRAQTANARQWENETDREDRDGLLTARNPDAIVDYRV